MRRTCFGANSPSTMCRSVRHTPHAFTRSSTCPERTRGSATSMICNGRSETGWGDESTAAFIRGGKLPNHHARDAHAAHPSGCTEVLLFLQGRQQFYRANFKGLEMNRD